MSPWEDISTEQLGEDISIDQQQLAESYLTRSLFRQILGASSDSRGTRPEPEHRSRSEGDEKAGSAPASVSLKCTVRVPRPGSTGSHMPQGSCE